MDIRLHGQRTSLIDVKETGIYDITVYGAQGGSSFLASGGLGEMGGDITLNGGQTLTILIGGKDGDGGSRCCGGGGGGVLPRKGHWAGRRPCGCAYA